MNYVLIVYLIAGQPAVTSAGEFPSEITCTYAGQTWVREHGEVAQRNASFGFSCLPKPKGMPEPTGQ